jgi:hypothetical protein
MLPVRITRHKRLRHKTHKAMRASSARRSVAATARPRSAPGTYGKARGVLGVEPIG